jgi:hypothetical protein
MASGTGTKKSELSAALTLVSSTSANTDSSTPLTSQQKAVLIDEYVECRERVKAWKPNVNPHAQRYLELQSLILAWYEKSPAEKSAVAEGNSYRLPISARENKRTVVNLAGLVRKLKLSWLLENCKVTLKAIEKAVPKEKLPLYIHEELAGPREIGEPVRKLEPAA